MIQHFFSGKVTRGYITHRLEDASKSSGSLINSLSTVSSHVKIITATDLTHAKSSVNYTICYHTILLSLRFRLSQSLLSGTNIDGAWVAEFSCPSCTLIVHNNNYSLSSPPTYNGLQLGFKIEKVEVRSRSYKGSISGAVSIMHNNRVLRVHQ